MTGDGTAAVRLSYRPEQEGEYDYVVGVEPLMNESNNENNRLTQRVHVRDETIRVLYVQEYPESGISLPEDAARTGPEASDGGKAIELKTVLQEADLEYVELDETANGCSRSVAKSCLATTSCSLAM